MKKTTAAEYAANVADSEPIEKVEKEIDDLKANSPTVKSAVIPPYPPRGKGRGERSFLFRISQA